MKKYIILIFLNIFIWYPALSFWFFGGWEQSWLIGVCGYNFTPLCLMKGHAFLYLVNYKLFGWNPTGWYLTALILQILAALCLFRFTILLTKSKKIAMLVAVFFSVNIAYNDVINWGSFEGLYALLLLCFFLAIFAYRKFTIDKSSRKFLWYGVVLLLYIFALFIRESGLVFPCLLLIFELYTNNFKLTKRYIAKLVYLFLPFGLISVGYILFRNWYGGAPHDLIDGMVQYRMTLLSQHQYGEYIWRGVLSFGKFAGSHLVPYTLMNSIRSFVAIFISSNLINMYFFTIVGWLYVVFMGGICFFFRKDKQTKNLLIFSFLWFVIPTLFFSFAWSITDSMLQTAYTSDSSRWRYFAFFGTVLFWVIFGLKVFEVLKTKYNPKQKMITISFVIFAISIILVNFFYLRKIQHEMYITSYKPAREFYTAFQKYFPTLPKDFIFSGYLYSGYLGDYLFEWYYLRQAYYPYLTENRINNWGEVYLGMLLPRLKDGSANLNSTFFVDYNDKDGLINNTEKMRKVLLSQSGYTYLINKTVESKNMLLSKKGRDDIIQQSLSPKLHVEIPYVYEITARAYPSYVIETSSMAIDKSKLLEHYVADRVDFLKNVSVTVCDTAPAGSQGKPAQPLLPQNIINGNIGPRSMWAANCRPSWVKLDLGKEKKIGAVIFRAPKNSPTNPSDYTISLSSDNTSWKEVISIKQNNLHQRMHVLSNPEDARYVRFNVTNTTQGAMLTLDALEVLDETSSSLVEYYGDNYEGLLADSLTLGTSYIRFSWVTQPNNFAVDEVEANNSYILPLVLDGQTHTYIIEPNENEYFSAPGQSLKRFTTDIYLDFIGIPTTVEVDSVKIVPKFPLVKEQ